MLDRMTDNEPDHDEDPKTVLIESLDRILYEIGRMDTMLLAAPRDHDLGMIREARRRTTLLFDHANAFFEWVTDTRLTPPAN